MRISTAVVSALVAGGSLSLSLQYASGQQSSTALDLVALDDVTPAADSAPTATDTGAAADTTTTDAGSVASSPAGSQAADSAAASSSPTETQAQSAPQTTSTAQSSPTTTAPESQPTQTATQEPAPEPAPAPVEKTVTSDVINYKYGVVQISLTAVGSDVTNVTLLQGDASYGRDVAYAALIDATVKTDGINYGNVSGATFTTDAFKKAVTNAISKL